MKPITRTVLRYTAFVIAAFVTIVVLIGSWISFQGRREWAAAKAELLARGEKLSLVELAPPEIPDERNFFADPLWEEVFAVNADGSRAVPYQQRRLNAFGERISPELKHEMDTVFDGTPFQLKSDMRRYAAGRAAYNLPSLDDPKRRQKASHLILETLAPVAPLLDKIEALLQRPDARAPIAYELGYRAPLEHFGYFLDLSEAFSARAIAKLALGDPNAAAGDILTDLRLADALRSEPLLISQLVRDAVIGKVLTALDVGISMNAWTEETLAPIQNALESTRSMETLTRALRGERGGGNHVFESLHAGANNKDNVFRIVAGASNNAVPPRPLSPPEQAAYLAMFRPGDQALRNRTIQKWIDAIEKDGDLGIDPAKLYDPAESLDANPFAYQRFHFWILGLSSLHDSIVKRLRTQEKITLTLIACALERYRFKHGAYPETLRDLEPEFLTAIPRPVIAGQTFHYEPLGDHFRLWSDGWNQTDEGGKSERNARNGDWVWGAR